jgi:hypothetical protein
VRSRDQPWHPPPEHVFSTQLPPHVRWQPPPLHVNEHVAPGVQFCWQWPPEHVKLQWPAAQICSQCAPAQVALHPLQVCMQWPCAQSPPPPPNPPKPGIVSGTAPGAPLVAAPAAWCPGALAA